MVSANFRETFSRRHANATNACADTILPRSHPPIVFHFQNMRCFANWYSTYSVTPNPEWEMARILPKEYTYSWYLKLRTGRLQVIDLFSLGVCLPITDRVIFSVIFSSLYFTFDPGLTATVTVNFIFTSREPNVYKPHGFFLGFLATFICFCVTVSFYRSLYFVVNQIKSRGEKNIHSYSRDFLKISQDYDHIGGAGMVEWHSPSHQCDPGSLPGPAVIWG